MDDTSVREPSRVAQLADAALIAVAVFALAVLMVGGLLWYVEDHIEDTGVKVIIATVGCFTVLGAVIGVSMLMVWVVRRGLSTVAEQNVGLQNAVVELVKESREGRAEERKMLAQIVAVMQQPLAPAPAQIAAPDASLRFERMPGTSTYVDPSAVIADAQKIYKALHPIGMRPSRANIGRMTGITDHDRQDWAKGKLIKWGVMSESKKGSAPAWVDAPAGEGEADE